VRLQYNRFEERENLMKIIRTQIVKIGNSRGVRLPKLLIEQIGFGSEVEIVVQRGQLVLRPAVLTRRGWAEQFSAMAKQGDDKMLDESTPTQWDRNEWQW
jgi:antitoxin MazE